MSIKTVTNRKLQIQDISVCVKLVSETCDSFCRCIMMRRRCNPIEKQSILFVSTMHVTSTCMNLEPVVYSKAFVQKNPYGLQTWRKTIAVFVQTPYKSIRMTTYSLLSSILGLQSLLIVAVRPSEVAVRYRRPTIPITENRRVRTLKVLLSIYSLYLIRNQPTGPQ